MSQTEAIVESYSEAQLAALRAALAGIALVALVYVRRLPTHARPEAAKS